TVIFNNQLASRNVPAIQPIVVGNESQRLTITGAGGGTFTLSIRDQASPTTTVLGPTAAINYDPDAATQAGFIQTALNNLLQSSNPAYANTVLVTPITTPTTSDFLITFQNQLAKANIGPIAATFVGTLTPSGVSSVTLATLSEGGGNSTQTLSFAGAPGGTTILSFNGLSATV